MINVFLRDMPHRIKAVHESNDDGSYSIFLNSRLSREAQEEGYEHEVRHIVNGDLDSFDNVDEIELRTHGY